MEISKLEIEANLLSDILEPECDSQSSSVEPRRPASTFPMLDHESIL